MKGTLLLALCATVFVLAGIEVARAATFTVNSIDDVDDGVCNGAHCSLREALNAANANGNAPVIDTVGFNLSPGTHTISPLTALPVITDSLKIIGNFLLTKPTIELDGSGIAGAANGLHLLGDNNQIIGWLCQTNAS